MIGALIYTGTFIISGNWDYRLIFLLFCIPFFMGLKELGLRLGLSALMLFALNYKPLSIIFGEIGILLNISSKIILFVILLAMIIARVGVMLEPFVVVVRKKFN